MTWYCPKCGDPMHTKTYYDTRGECWSCGFRVTSVKQYDDAWRDKRVRLEIDQLVQEGSHMEAAVLQLSHDLELDEAYARELMVRIVSAVKHEVQ